MGRHIIMSLLGKNSKILQLLNRKWMNLITFCICFAGTKSRLIHVIHQSFCCFRIIAYAYLPHRIIRYLLPFQFQFMQTTSICRTAGAIHPNVRRLFLTNRGKVIRTITSMEYFHFKNCLTIYCFRRNLHVDLRRTGIGDHIGNSIRQLKRVLISKTDNLTRFIFYAYNCFSSGGVGKRNNVFQKLFVFLWDFRFKFNVLAFSEQFFFNDHAFHLLAAFSRPIFTKFN